MEILLWLVPPFVCAVVAMILVGWVSREGRGQFDPDERVQLIGSVLDREPRHHERPTTEERERSTGVAVRKPVGSG